MSKIKAVLFDLDGTLINTLDDLADATNIALQRFGYPMHEVNEFKLFVGNGIPKMIERALPEGEKSKENIDKVKAAFFEYYDVHYKDKTTYYDGVADLIAGLRAKGIKTAVVTNKAEHVAVLILNDLYPDCFDLIFGNRDGVPPKPDPTLTLLAMDTLGVKPDECIFMGDSGVDVSTAVNSGAYPVGVLWGFREREELMENGAAEVISAPDELFGIIKKLG